MSQTLVIVVAAAGGVMILGMMLVVSRCYRRVASGHALVVNKMQGPPLVTFTGAMVLPIVHEAEVMDIGVKPIVISRRGNDGIICEDNIRADVEARFYIRVNNTSDDIVRVARTIGCERAGQQATLEELFAAKFSEALKIAAKMMQFEQLYTQRDKLEDQVLSIIGKDLNGFVIDDVVIDQIAQTPLELLDPDNILDALGIEKIRRITAGAHAEIARLAQQTAQRDRVAGELESLGLLDVRVAFEVSCDISADRATATFVLGDAKLPGDIAPSIVHAAGRGELAITDGRATIRFTDARVTDSQLIAAARIVHAVRGSSAYR